MLKWLRREKQEAPTWRMCYGIPTKSTTPPEWVEELKKPQQGVGGSFCLREEAPQWIFNGSAADEEIQTLLENTKGLAILMAQYTESTNQKHQGKAYLAMVELAHRFAQREVGVVVNIFAYRLYKSAEWQAKLDTFDVTDHTTIHVVEDDMALDSQWLHSHGFLQFGIPEVEVRAVPEDDQALAIEFIHMMGELMMMGERFEDGHTISAPWNPEVWAICEFIQATDNDGHGAPEYQLLRFSDFDQETGEKKVGLTRFLEGLGSGSEE